MKKLGLTFAGAFGACALGAMTVGVSAVPALAQASAEQSQVASRLTVADLAGTWVEPETLSDDEGMKIVGTENIVEIRSDGSFTDALDLSFEFADVPEYNGTYRLTSAGRITIADDNITWATESAKVVPQFPANVTEARRAEMQEFADQLVEGMIGSETYPIISYDGREMVMNAGAYSAFEEYSMVRR